MARTPAFDDQPLRRIARSVLPPAAMVLLSSAILAGAIWVRKQENAARLESSSNVSLGTTGAIGGAVGTTGSDRSQSLTQPHVTTHSTSKGSSDAHGKTTHTGSNKVSQPNGTKTSQSTGKPGHSTVPSGSTDIGFTPVTGGAVASIVSGKRPSGSTEVSSVVSEFGTHPDTTWQQSSVSGPNGVALTLPAAASPSSYVVLPQSQGVLWAQIPQTQISPTGTLGPSDTTTTLWYTPFPTTGTQVITQNAQLLGTIPATATGIDSNLTQPSVSSSPFTLAIPPMTWYGSTKGAQATHNGSLTGNSTGTSGGQANNSLGTTSTSSGNNTSSSTSTSSGPSSGSSGTSAGSSTSNSTSGGTSSSGTSGTTGSTGSNSSSNTSSSGSGSTLPPSTASATSSVTNLYLSGLYQTSQGAVIALAATSSSATDATATWLYDWREATAQLTPIAALTNGNGTFSWFAPGANQLYFGIRSVLPPYRTSFSGHQFVYDTAIGKLTPIRLGTWTSSAYTSGGKLIFDVRNSISWESFTPAGQP